MARLAEMAELEDDDVLEHPSGAITSRYENERCARLEHGTPARLRVADTDRVVSQAESTSLAHSYLLGPSARLPPISYDLTPDHQPLLGPLSGQEGLWIAAGYSGHGFMLAPAISSRLAATLTGAPTDDLLSGFELGRFARTELEVETQVV